ncbi:hypothetical protein QZH41_010714, partial [Actinostola sp. cb2023]
QSLKCHNLTVPVCQNIGYKKTVLSEGKQNAYSLWASINLNSLRDNSTCSLPGKRLFCMENFPPCIDNSIAYYCRPKCEKFFQMNCTLPLRFDINICMELPNGTAENDMCKQTHWPRAENWPQVRSTKPPIGSSFQYTRNNRPSNINPYTNHYG